MDIKNKLKQISGSWYFLISMIIVYILVLIIKPSLFSSSMTFFGKILLQLIPVFVLIFVLMAIINYFITPKWVMKHLGGKGIKKWVYVIIGGILSSGPIYMWYPLLSDLQKKGLSSGLIACFLYNRAIKIALIPLAIVYFSWQYILVLLVVMIFISVIQGLLLDKLMGIKHEKDISVANV